MMRVILVATLLGLHSAALPSPWTCTEPTSNEWLTPRHSVPAETYSKTGFTLDPERVLPVETELEEAVARLKHRAIIPLKISDARRYTGKSDLVPLGARLKPYLVRAVYPTGNPVLAVSTYGKVIVVHAAGLGCHPFLKHPVVILLEKPPQKVVVGASAAL